MFQHHVGSNHVHWFPHDPMQHTRKNRVSKISAFEGSRSFLRRRLCPIMFERILDVSRETRSRGPAKRKYSICFHSSFKLQGYAGCVWEAKIYENLQHVARTAYLNSECHRWTSMVLMQSPFYATPELTLSNVLQENKLPY